MSLPMSEYVADVEPNKAQPRELDMGDYEKRARERRSRCRQCVPSCVVLAIP